MSAASSTVTPGHRPKRTATCSAVQAGAGGVLAGPFPNRVIQFWYNGLPNQRMQTTAGTFTQE
jgi:hypothetical protein